MSVRVGDRHASRIEYLYQGDKLHRAILDLTFREFGIHSKHSPFRKKYLYLLNNKSKYEVEGFVDKYCRDLEKLSDDLLFTLGKINSIRVNTKIEYEIRARYILDAISSLTSIKVILNRIADYFDVDINLFKETILILDAEQKLLSNLKRLNDKQLGQFL